MTRRISKDSVDGIETLCTECEDLTFGVVNIIDHDVQMKLLRTTRIRPSGSLKICGPLEGQTGRGVICGDHHPVGALVRHR
jgi:hypothetical protein